jgi:hypothetical protein
MEFMLDSCKELQAVVVMPALLLLLLLPWVVVDAMIVLVAVTVTISVRILNGIALIARHASHTHTSQSFKNPERRQVRRQRFRQSVVFTDVFVKNCFYNLPSTHVCVYACSVLLPLRANGLRKASTIKY